MPLSTLEVCSLSAGASLHLVTLSWTIHGAIQYLASALGCGITVTVLRARDILFCESEGVASPATQRSHPANALHQSPSLHAQTLARHAQNWKLVTESAERRCPPRLAIAELTEAVTLSIVLQNLFDSRGMSAGDLGDFGDRGDTHHSLCRLVLGIHKRFADVLASSHML